MSRHSDNLERLCNKLQARFGAADALFLEVKTELEAHVATAQACCQRHDWSIPYHAFIKKWDDETLVRQH